MSFLREVDESSASGDVRALYDRTRDDGGSVPNYVKAFSLRPRAYEGWEALNGAIKAGMDARSYELATLASARALRSSYCSLAHGNVLRQRFLDDEALERLLTDGHDPSVSEAERAMMRFAERVTLDPSGIQESEIDALRAHGFDDDDVLDIVLAASARNFFSRVLEALGALPDAKYAELPQGLRDVLAIGRPIARPGTEA